MTKGVRARLATLLLIVALAWQGFVTQTHSHPGFDGQPVATASTASPVAIGKSGQEPATPVCPLCEEQALFGAYLLSSQITFVAPVAVEHYFSPGILPAFSFNALSHSWQSRAPPILHDLKTA